MDLDTKIQYLTGVGPKITEKLHKLGIFCVKDLLFYYPRRYQDFTSITKIGEIQISSGRSFDYAQDDLIKNNKVTIRGKILEIVNKRTSRRRFTVTEAIVEDESGSIKVVWFNQPFITKMFKPGHSTLRGEPSGSDSKSRELILNGKVTYNWYSKEVVMESPERALKPSIVPIYPETAGMTSRYILKLISHISYLIDQIEEWLLGELIQKSKVNGFDYAHHCPEQSRMGKSQNYNSKSLNLIPIQEAIKELHFPTSMANIRRAQRRIAFDELFLISLRANLSKEQIKKEKAPVLDINDKNTAVADFLLSLPFKLTDDQRKAAWQIIKDIKNPVPMNRLLNGDVGSGKTVVAAIAAFVAIRAGFKAVLMAPTEILAKQHYETFKTLFSKKEVGLLTSSAKENTNANIMIGTHALLQDKIDLGDVGLVTIDEQHRFGVAQRSKLLKINHNGLRPHFLSMTATPIPRTLHLALFGDLDISVIREKPADRKEIKTRFVSTQNREKAYQFIRAQIDHGRQAFVICPLIEDKSETRNSKLETNSKSEIQNNETIQQFSNLTIDFDERKTVIEEHRKLQAIFPEFKIGVLHGRMKAKEKDTVMADFVVNKTHILVSTSVVEVGVDIPNASVMVIEDAERFGLAQIHQFRGRVGRAEHQSFCFLFSSTMSEKALKRLANLEATSDGFKLAEIDLETRGPGAVFGTEQSGLLDLKMATLADRELIEEASGVAKSIIASDSELKNHPLLKNRVSEYMQNKHLE